MLLFCAMYCLDDGLQKRPKYVAIVIYIINILLRSVGENKHVSWHVFYELCRFFCYTTLCDSYRMDKKLNTIEPRSKWQNDEALYDLATLWLSFIADLALNWCLCDANSFTNSCKQQTYLHPHKLGKVITISYFTKRVF